MAQISRYRIAVVGVVRMGGVDKWMIDSYTHTQRFRDCALINTIVGTRHPLYYPPLYFAIDIGQYLFFLNPCVANQHTILVLVLPILCKGQLTQQPIPWSSLLQCDSSCVTPGTPQQGWGNF